jgi:hypothetical protein
MSIRCKVTTDNKRGGITRCCPSYYQNLPQIPLKWSFQVGLSRRVGCPLQLYVEWKKKLLAPGMRERIQVRSQKHCLSFSFNKP